MWPTPTEDRPPALSFAHCFTREAIAAELRDGGWELVRYGNDESGYAVARRVGLGARHYLA